jgi:hypothetical protein
MQPTWPQWLRDIYMNYIYIYFILLPESKISDGDIINHDLEVHGTLLEGTTNLTTHLVALGEQL